MEIILQKFDVYVNNGYNIVKREVMMARYILSEKELPENEYPLATDYYYEAFHSYNSEFHTMHTHAHNYYEIYFFMQGKVKLSIEEHLFEVKRGDFVVIPPYLMHRVVVEDSKIPYERMYLLITSHCLDTFSFRENSLLTSLLFAEKDKQFVFHMSDANDFEAMVRCIDSLYDSKRGNFYGKEMLNRSNILLFMTTINKYIEKYRYGRRTREEDHFMSEVVSYINDNIQNELSVEDIAKHFFISKYTIMRTFRENTNLTVYQYILEKRVNLAKQIMQVGGTPTEVFHRCGFKDYSNFYRTFLKYENMTPKEFMKLSKDKEESGKS